LRPAVYGAARLAQGLTKNHRRDKRASSAHAYRRTWRDLASADRQIWRIDVGVSQHRNLKAVAP